MRSTPSRFSLAIIGLLLLSNAVTLFFLLDSPQLYRFRSLLVRDDARFTDASGRTPVQDANTRGYAIFLTYGQSNAGNSGQIGYVPGRQVLNFHDGVLYRYEDPALGGQGRQGSVWGRVGDRLVSRDAYPGVVFALAGANGKTLEQLSQPPHYDHLLRQYAALQRHFGHVDAILLHQGEANHRHRQGGDYRRAFLAFERQLRRDGIQVPLYLAQASYCGNSVDPALLAVQDQLIRELPGVLRGPNTDTLIAPRYRLPDRCHFSAEGLDAAAALWVQSFLAASEI
ncbi:MAG TPA: sialate O-acetylesterase [Pseudomonas sp.]|nr:sialate O-acetylesterase [Pseudomonas sp.]